jgi:hypothetical protein
MISLPLTQEQKVWAQRAALNAGYLFQEMLNAVERPPTADPPEGEEWFEKKTEPNPCVRLFGKGPIEVSCKHCKHLIRHKPGNNTYLKCFYRGVTHGPGTDHRAGWASCSKYEREQ